MLAHLRATLERPDLPEGARQKIRAVQRVLDGDPQARLRSFRMVGHEPYASVAFGDPDGADLVVYLLHGIDTGLELFPAWAEAAQRLCADVIRGCVARGEPRSVATIAWFDWDSGSHVTALSTQLATVGAAQLSIEIDGLVAQNPAVHVAVVAYSYGSTLVGEMFALTMGAHVDTVFSIASAGLTAAAGSALTDAIADGDVVVHATESEGDGVAPLGRLGQHPLDPRDMRGVRVYGSDGGEVLTADGGTTTAVDVDGHSSQSWVDDRGNRRPGYFGPRTQAYLTLVTRLVDAVTAR